MILRTGLIAALLLVTGCKAPPVPEAEPAVEAPPVPPPFAHVDYDDMRNWLCHPDMPEGNACDVDLTATVIHEDGTTEIEESYALLDTAPFDCFYIYPTVSFDQTWNSDLLTGPEELNVAENQLARYGSVCNLYAPIYRQRTLLELQTLMVTGVSNANVEMRWADVVDSWEYYLEHNNKGRPVLLIGHSQGADMVLQLLKAEIIGKPVQAQIVGAHAIGFTAHADADGTFGGMPVCSAPGEAGCLVNYESFRATAEPPAASRFGLKAADGRSAICTSPPALVEAGATALDAYMPAQSFSAAEPTDFGAPVSTPFVKLPGLVSGECRSNATHDWFAVTVAPGDGPRVDDIRGDVMFNGQVVAEWGLHLVDMNLAMGNLVALAALQAEAWQAAQTGD
ncbi:MAG: DUF3089 domain-containing protein [Hyphomonas sp.]|uniref:DUF3089 domain-containing protein n=1 Tax=Hyphomonas sp. TaxID=87 RepID=UPI001856E63F|nr:DUF3089 domain-containing protein [Hyphomonas sp.]MBU3919457.1 DUF3089 domain-containing protein [Alphaproteobacteria bacterium]MBA3069825.1 DUF3089 domain-containing protein [Hyphomonas sp.]MBU4062666.1 DUF3089 domain-containing protein [Alphaproteobacteria bacterium]MBU4164017.1 DUF3089 domain-containing protein [Alphaproteobacteria bacterium]MBU4567762.1 DUF3089 domain-containing protein [Alphaproteobacteria bacterium]